MNRYGHEENGVLCLSFWLVIKRGDAKRGWPAGHRDSPSVRVLAGEPSLSKNERALKLELNLPVAVFETPSLRASINIEKPSEAVAIDIRGVAEAVKQSIGMDVDFTIVMPEEDTSE